MKLIKMEKKNKQKNLPRESCRLKACRDDIVLAGLSARFILIGNRVLIGSI